MRSICTLGFALALLALAAGPLRAAQLNGSAGTPSSANLTIEGTTDWIHWGQNGKNDVNRKSSGGSLFSNISLIHTNTTTNIARLSESISKVSYTDGLPTSTVTDSPMGIYTNNFDGPGRGFMFTAPADLLERTVRVYVGEFNASGTMEASLSDSSASIFIDTVPGIAGQSVQTVYTFDYMAASEGQTLTIKWTETADLGAADNVTLQAATMQTLINIPEPTTLALLSGGLVLLAMRRRAS